MNNSTVNIRLLSHIGASLLLQLGAVGPVPAQIVPDATLPSNSRVTANGTTFTIDGGTVRGSNHFHSFTEFSIPTNAEAFFNNAASIENIITRVTGGTISNIDGLIRALGTANLFLLNPNGIIFGPNARLDIGGSFLGSTADSLLFDDGSSFSATNPASKPLLTINVPMGLQWNEGNRGRIEVRGGLNRSLPRAIDLAPIFGEGPQPAIAAWQNLSEELNVEGLSVRAGETLALLSGEISIANHVLTAPGGRVELSGVGERSYVGLTPVATGWEFNYQGVENKGSIDISASSLVNSSGRGGGNIAIQGDRATLTAGSVVLSSSLGNSDGGSIAVAADTFEVSGGSLLATGTYGTGRGGELQIAANHFILAGESVMATLSVSGGQSGNATLEGREVEIGGGSLLFTGALGELGRGGNLTVRTSRLAVKDGAQMSSSNFSVNEGGSLMIKADVVEVVGGTPSGSANSLIVVNSFSEGAGGSIEIEASQLLALNGGSIVAGSFGSGRGGNVTLNISDEILVSGRHFNNPSGISTNSFSSDRDGAGGNVKISTGQLTVAAGGRIGAGAFGNAPGGSVEIAADSVELVGFGDDRTYRAINTSSGEEAPFLPFFREIFTPDSFLPLTFEGTGAGGDLTIVAHSILLRQGATISASSDQTGDAGNINIRANKLGLDRRASIDARTVSGMGGKVTLVAEDLRLEGQSQITTNAGSSNGGNITINTDTLVALSDSDITANAEVGFGGRIMINAEGVFGTDFREALTSLSDITATSNLGPEFSGTVVINILGLDSEGLVEPPKNILDIEGLVGKDFCQVSKNSEFIITGRGGIPSSPSDYLGGTSVRVGLVDPAIGENSSGAIARQRRRGVPNRESQGAIAAPESGQLVEATGWIKHPDGTIELVAQMPGMTVGGFQPVSCQDLSSAN